MNNWRTVSPYMTEDEAWNELADLEMLGIHYNVEERGKFGVLSRNEAVEQFLESDAEYLLYYDCPDEEPGEEKMGKDYGTICSKCNGLIARAGVTYGYSGDFCCCPDENATLDGAEIDMDDYVYDPVTKAYLLKPEKRKMIEEYTSYAKREIRFCPYCGAALGIV